MKPFVCVQQAHFMLFCPAYPRTAFFHVSKASFARKNRLYFFMRRVMVAMSAAHPKGGLALTNSMQVVKHYSSLFLVTCA